MEIKNFNEELPNILHFQGKSDIMKHMFERQVTDTVENKFEGFPKDLTVITTFTDKNASALVYQLDKNNIPYINSYKEEYGPFAMTNKVIYIIDALKAVKTKYTLILDGYDVLLQTLDDLMNRYKSYNAKILFNASKNNYPVVVLDKMPHRDYIGQFNCFNAGCSIGETEALLKFYKDAKNIMENKKFFNPFNSEQFILRHVFAKYSEHMFDDEPKEKYIMIDYECKVFLALSQALVIPIKHNDNEIKTM